MRRLTAPPAGIVKLMPVKLMLWLVTRPAMVVELEPAVTVNRLSKVIASGVTRLVMLTGRKIDKLPVTTVPAVPPAHCRRMSPLLSVTPSDRTSGGTAEGLH